MPVGAIRDAASETVRRRPIGVLVKPASSLCNLRCSYCFYLAKQGMYPWERGPRLSLETFERFLTSYLAWNGPQLSFAWQGGEPTLMGLDFYESMLQRQGELAPRARVTHALQTNGTLLDRSWAQFLRAHDFLVGVSLDGPPEWHDHYRRDAGDRETHHRVLQGLDHLRGAGVDFNVLTVVQASNVGRPRDLLRYLVRLGLDNLQFIPLAEAAPGSDAIAHGGLAPGAIGAAAYGDFLCGLFDAWLEAGTERVRIRFFDNAVQMLLGVPAEVCQLAPACGGYVVLEHNGDCYPCDFFVEGDWRLGNIHEMGLEEMLAGERFGHFLTLKPNLPKACLDCRWRPLCHGECPRYRQMSGGDAATSLPHFCGSYRRFYAYAYDRLCGVASEARRRVGVPLPAPGLDAARLAAARFRAGQGPAMGDAAAAELPGRNDPCPCGSGQKYKKCCGL